MKCIVTSGLQAAAEDDAGNFVGEQIRVTRFTLLVRQRPQVVNLSVAEYLHALVGKILREPAQRQAGAVDRRFANDAAQLHPFRKQPHFQGRAVLLEKLFNRDGRLRHELR
jgi:hypothetical protein